MLSKIFARDFALISLDIAYQCESSTQKPWLRGEASPHSPYLFFEHTDGTSYIWFSDEGVEWVNQILKQRAKEDPTFLETVKRNIEQGISWIGPLYEKPRALSRVELLRFIDEFIAVYNWAEAMWWLCKIPAEELGVEENILIKVREKTEKMSAGTDSVIRQSLEGLYPELGFLSSLIRLDEFRQGAIPDVAELQKRSDGFVYVNGEAITGMTREQVGERFDIQFAEEESTRPSHVLHGNSASPGVVTGIVCRVMGHRDFGKTQPGQILVSPMTMPDFLPEMRRAAAIVTDEGGVTCHAAIVSREMGKPCVIGTKTATKALKDGDEVEVDATRGIVTILKRI